MIIVEMEKNAFKENAKVNAQVMMNVHQNIFQSVKVNFVFLATKMNNAQMKVYQDAIMDSVWNVLIQ